MFPPCGPTARCRVVALADVQRPAAEAMNAENGFGAAVYADHREMLARERPDVVVSCLWTPLHLPVFRDCVDAGVRAVLSEKPMAPTWGECLEMARLAEDSGCQLTFCHQRRFAAGQSARPAADRRGAVRRRSSGWTCTRRRTCWTAARTRSTRRFSFNGETPAKWVLGAVDATRDC